MNTLQLSWAIVFVAMALSWCLGYRAKNPKRFSGVLGTLFIFSAYGFAVAIVNFVVMILLWRMGVQKGSESGLSESLLPLLMTPFYLISVFTGMLAGKKIQ